MPKFCTQQQVRHSAQKMFALVADIERYPEFLPMCEALTIRSRREQDGNMLLVADMSVGYKLVRESFTTQVYLQPEACRIDVHYIDGPFKYLQNRWQFLPAGAGAEEGAAAGPGDSGAAAEAKGAAEAVESGAAPAAAGDDGVGAAGQATETAGAAGGTGAAGRAGKAADSIIAAGAAESCIVDFYIDYAFKNPMLSMLMGAMFDIAFRKFTAAFITRADEIYGANS